MLHLKEKLIGICVVSTLLSLISCEVPSPQTKPDVRSHAFLNRIASEINKSLPMRVDSLSELTSVVGLEGTIVYNYRLLDQTANQLDTSRIRIDLRPAVVRGACTTPQTRQDFLNENITMRYTYYDMLRTYLASFDVRLSDCDSSD